MQCNQPTFKNSSSKTYLGFLLDSMTLGATFRYRETKNTHEFYKDLEDYYLCIHSRDEIHLTRRAHQDNRRLHS